MSLETLLEAARYVEQQELRAKHQQSLVPRPLLSPPGAPAGTAVVSVPSPPSGTFKIVSPVALAGQQPQLSASPPAALVAVPQVRHGQPVEVGGHSLVAPASVPSHMVVVAPRPPGAATGTAISAGMMSTAQQPVVELLTKPLPLLNGFDKTLLIPAPTISPPTVSTPHSTAPDSTHPTPKHLPPPPVPSPTTTSTISTSATSSAKRLIVHNSQTSNSVVSSTTGNNGNSTSGHGPSVMRSGTREVHNKLEKNRRAHLKECFEMLKKQLPPQQDEKKSSNLSILHSALRHIQALKKRERDNEHEMERLARDKIAAQQRLAALKKELGSQWDNIDFNCLIPENGSSVVQHTITTPVPATPTPAPHSHYPAPSSTLTPTTLTLTPTTLTTPSTPTTTSGAQPVSVLPLHSPVYHPVGVGPGLAVVNLHKLVVGGAKAVQVVQSPLAHLIAAPQQLNGKVVPLVNAQYLMKPVVVVSTPSSSRQS